MTKILKGLKEEDVYVELDQLDHFDAISWKLNIDAMNFPVVTGELKTKTLMNCKTLTLTRSDNNFSVSGNVRWLDVKAVNYYGLNVSNKSNSNNKHYIQQFEMHVTEITQYKNNKS